MKDILLHNLLGVPLITWGLQLLYVASALVVLAMMAHKHKPSVSFVVLYVLVMVAVNIVWRLAFSHLLLSKVLG